MAISYLPPIRHLLPLTTIRRLRELPVPGAITVRVNEKVQAQDVVGEAEVQPRHIFLDLARGLGVADVQVPRYMAKAPGEDVNADEVIAGPAGLARRTLRAPEDGRIIALVRGRVLFRTRGRSFEMRAGFPGLVVSTDGVQSVTLETSGALVGAQWGNGRQDYGVMRIIGDGPSSRLQTRQLDIQLRGAILVAGRVDHPAPLKQAAELSIRGLILGGMAAALIPSVRRLPFPVVVLGGFGEFGISEPVYSLLAGNAGREAAVDARTPSAFEPLGPEVIIPLPTDRPVEIPEEIVPLVPGVRVRVVRPPMKGVVGTVREVLPHAEAFPSGLLARSVLISIEGTGPARVPLANIEILG